jgi:hypothetical protein
VVLSKSLRKLGANLGDFSFHNDNPTLADACLNVEIRRLRVAVRIGLDTMTFIAMHPAWEIAPELTAAFELVSSDLADVVGASPTSQQSTLSFHLTPGTSDFQNITAALVNKEVLGEAAFFGISLYRTDSTLLIDKSLRHAGAVFIRLQRIFAGDAAWPNILLRLYEDEMQALRLLGISEIPLN